MGSNGLTACNVDNRGVGNTGEIHGCVSRREGQACVFLSLLAAG